MTMTYENIYRAGTKIDKFQADIFPGTPRDFDNYQYQHLVSQVCRKCIEFNSFTVTKSKAEEGNYVYYLVEARIHDDDN